jgi:hypothetical protein
MGAPLTPSFVSWTKLPTTTIVKWKKRFVLFLPPRSVPFPVPRASSLHLSHRRPSLSRIGASPSPASVPPPSFAVADCPPLAGSREVATVVEHVGFGARALGKTVPCPPTPVRSLRLGEAVPRPLRRGQTAPAPMRSLASSLCA